MADVEGTTVEAQGHDRTIAICRKIRTLVIKHPGRGIRYHEALYHPTHRNLVSGHRMPDYSRKAAGRDVDLKFD